MPSVTIVTSANFSAWVETDPGHYQRHIFIDSEQFYDWMQTLPYPHPTICTYHRPCRGARPIDHRNECIIPPDLPLIPITRQEIDRIKADPILRELFF